MQPGGRVRGTGPENGINGPQKHPIEKARPTPGSANRHDWTSSKLLSPNENKFEEKKRKEKKDRVESYKSPLAPRSTPWAASRC